jgi:hypothetical protein
MRNVIPRQALITILTLVAAAASAADLSTFEKYFEDATMRVDYYHTGSAAEEVIALDRVVREGMWAGSRVHLADAYDTGGYAVVIYDVASGTRLFSRGFDSYFGEYRTTEAATKGVRRTYQESALVPFPRKPVRLVVEARGRDQVLRPIFETVIDPAAYTVVRETPTPGATVIPVLTCGDPHRCVDIAVLAEGYTAEEEGKFRRDLGRAVGTLTAVEPFASAKRRFNISGVFAPSAQSGCDEPSRGVWRNTILDASFDALGSERYLLSENNRAIRDLAAQVPSDAILIMVNSPRYGGGGIYNLYCTFTSDNQWTPYVMVHEFGHAFAGLADEYYTSSVAYSDFYPKGVEPASPNVTALLDPANLKWKALVTPGTPIPTPWEKAGFDEMDRAYQKTREELNARIATLMRAGAPAAEVDALKERAETLSKSHADEVDAYLAKSAWVGKVGAFEGAGYASHGLYRPMLDCIMFTKGRKPFCTVCRDAISRVIDHFDE